MESSIITGKITTKTPTTSNALGKRLYVKIFPGAFTLRAPRPKKAKILSGELLVRYSSREWPEKKNGPLVGDQGFLEGVANLLRDVNLVNVNDLYWPDEQRNLKETITIRVGKDLAQEIIDRGWASLE
jgi:hypothetical protein